MVGPLEEGGGGGVAGCRGTGIWGGSWRGEIDKQLVVAREGGGGGGSRDSKGVDK